MDEQRKLLDSLMGINRNRDRADEEIKDFRDSRVCKFFLFGMCPHDMFVNTKVDDGPCPKLHLEELKDEFEKSADKTIFDTEIEREYNDRINDIDRAIKRARSRVEEERGEDGINPDSNPDLLRIQAETERMQAEAERAGEEGDIDKAQESMALVEALHSEKEAVLKRIEEQRRALIQRTGMDVNKKLRVCDVCGCFLSILDSDKRLSDHFTGKQHIGYQVMRDAVVEIRKRRDEKRAAMDAERANREKERSRERERDRSRMSARADSRDRDRDGRMRERDARDRARGDSRDRGRRRDSREGDRDTYRSSKGSRDRERDNRGGSSWRR